MTITNIHNNTASCLLYVLSLNVTKDTNGCPIVSGIAALNRPSTERISSTLKNSFQVQLSVALIGNVVFNHGKSFSESSLTLRALNNYYSINEEQQNIPGNSLRAYPGLTFSLVFVIVYL
ncbi:hypothetical protein J6590_022832 [Homalodisca vitripennis]|nr:hypothetical protein J6590_022832 [Homalodisca vitripennis]